MHSIHRNLTWHTSGAGGLDVEGNSPTVILTVLYVGLNADICTYFFNDLVNGK